MSMEGICQKISRLAARRAEIAWVHFCKCLRNCTNARVYRWKQEAFRFDLGDADISVDPAHKKCRSRLCAREYKTEWQGKISRNLLASQLCSAMPPLESVKVLVSIMMSVGWSSKCNLLKSMQYDLSRAHFKEQPRDSNVCPSSSGRSTETWRGQSWQIDQEHARNSRCFTSGNLIM